MKIQLINPNSLILRLDIERTAQAGEAIYERITGKFKFLVDTDEYTLDRHGFTNLGSTPRFLHPIKYFEPWRYPCTYSGHDGGYEDEGFWVNGVFVKFPREYIDEIMKNMIVAEGIYYKREFQARIASPIIYSGVRLGGWKAWDNYRKLK